MKSRSNTPLILFGCMLAADLLAVIFKLDTLRWVTKPLLMPLLLWYYRSCVTEKSLLRNLFSAALIFSWSGDVCLLWKQGFIPGLLCFLLAHMMYCLYFLRTGPGQKGLLQWQPLIGSPVVAYIILFLALLYPALVELKIPVTVYAMVIGSMLLLAINTVRKVPASASLLFIHGAIQFVISDSLLSIEKFIFPVPYLGVAVMLTYGSAQWLLTRGSILHLQSSASAIEIKRNTQSR